MLRKAVISQQLNREDDAKKLAERIEKTIALNENENNKHYDIKKIKEYCLTRNYVVFVLEKTNIVLEKKKNFLEKILILI